MNGLAAAWAVARHDLRLHLAQPVAALMTIAVPVNFLILFILFAVGGGIAPVAVHQADVGRFAPAFTAALKDTQTFRVEPAATPAAALFAIRNHTAVAAVTVPPGFSRAVAADRAVALPVTIDNANGDFADDIRRGMPLAILQFYRHDLPDRLPVSWRETDTYPRTVGFLGYIAVGVLTASLLVGGLLIGSFGMVREWERGTIGELLLAPVSGWSVVAGKLVSSFILGLMAAACVLAILWFIGVRPQNWGPVLAVVPLVLLVFVSLGLAAGNMLRSSRATAPVAMGVALPLFFVSGPFGPTTWGIPAAAFVARLFPVAYANTVLLHAMYGYWVMAVSPGVVWTVLAAWVAAAVAAGVSAYRRATAPQGN